jgi:HEAT repeat protein
MSLKNQGMRIQILSVILITFFFFEIGSVVLYAEEISYEKIVSTLLDKNSSESNKILSYISRVKPPQIPPLLVREILSERDNSSKQAAMRALQKYPLRRYIPLWLEILEKIDSFIIKNQIIDIIAASGDRRIVMTLVRELNNPFYAVRNSAILALKHIGDDRVFPYILNMSKSPDPIYRVYSLEAIYHLYDRRIYFILIDMLKDRNKSVRYYALRCIEKNKLNQALTHIRNAAIRDNNFEVRVKAIEILGGFRDYNSRYVLLKCLSDSNRSIRYASAISLYLLRLQKSAYSLSDRLYYESDDSVKEVIIETLIRLKNGGGLRGLRRVLERDKNPKMRILAAYALGKIKNRKSTALLLSAIHDKEIKVRAEVCSSLGNYRDKIVVRKLIRVINGDRFRYVRTAALYALMSIRDRSSVLPLFDRYAFEEDPVFKEKLRIFLREFIKKYK